MNNVDKGKKTKDLQESLKPFENSRIMRDIRTPRAKPLDLEKIDVNEDPQNDPDSAIPLSQGPEVLENIEGHQASLSAVIDDSSANFQDDTESPGIRVLEKASRNEEGLLSELIMPDGSQLEVEVLRQRVGKSRNLEHRRVPLPEKVDTLWDKTINEITQLDKKKIAKPQLPEISPKKLKLSARIVSRFKREKIALEDYDINTHGPVVDLSLKENYKYEEVELYTVNEPFAYIRISYDPEGHSYLYEVKEPELDAGEKELFRELKMRLLETLEVNLKQLDEKGAKKYLLEKVNDIMGDYQIKIHTISHAKIMYFVFSEFMGYGKIDPLMHDPNLEDISCDGPYTPIYVYHRKYESIATNAVYENEIELDAYVVRLAQICGRHISIADPLLDATMPDGSRVQLTLGREVTTRGSSYTIRKFKESPLTPPDLIDFKTYSTSTMAYLWLAAENNKNIIFAGGTASGKTTAMNAIALFIPPQSKIVSIEDTRELNLPHPNWIAGVTRDTFTGGETGSIDMYDLLKAALRQRPEYMLVGEVRGAEAYVLFQAMSTGHTTFSTMHADSVQSVVHRLENPPINVPRIMLQALDIVIVQVQVRIGEQRVRRARTITEIVGVDPRTGELLTNELFTWSALKDEFTYSGRSYVLDSIMNNRGWNDTRLKIELKNRQEILEWARMKNVKHYEDVAKIVVTYYREPETFMNIVRRDLYGS